MEEKNMGFNDMIFISDWTVKFFQRQRKLLHLDYGKKDLFSFFSITDEPFTITPRAFIKDQFWFHVSTSSNSASRYFHPLRIPVHPSENEVMPAAVSHTEIPDPFSISAAFNASYLICTSSSFQKKWHIISLDQPQSTSSTSSRVVYPRKNLQEWKKRDEEREKIVYRSS